MRYSVAIAPSRLPVTLAEGKAQCRIDIDDDDSLIVGYIDAATNRCQLAARRTFISTTFDLYFDRWPLSSIEFPLPPLQSVTGFYFTDDDGVETEWDVSNYIVDTTSKIGRLQFKRTAVLPSVTLQEINAVRIRFVAGYGDNTENVPEIYRQAIKMLLGHYYENREPVLIAQGLSLSELPLSVQDLLNMNRGGWF